MVNIKTSLWFLVLSSEAVAACGGGYQHCRQITFNHTKAGASDTPNVAALISGTYSYLAVQANGGQITNTTTQSAGGASITVPADLIFADSTCTAKIAGWEFESYNATSGDVKIHANVGTLTHSVDLASVYACYGNPAITTWQGNVGATWDGNYKFVAHMSDNAASTKIVDSTGNAFHAINESATNTKAATGMISGSLNFPGPGDYAFTPAITLQNNITFSAWVKLSALTGYGRILETDFRMAYALTLDASGATYAGYVGGTPINGGAPDTSTWHHVALTYDGVNARLFVDGAQIASSAVSAPGSQSFPLYLATWNGSPGSFGCQGSLDEVRISDLSRSADQILAEYNNQSDTSAFYTVGPDLGGSISSVRRRIL